MVDWWILGASSEIIAYINEQNKITVICFCNFLCRGGSSFFPRGGFDPTTMQSIVYEPRSGEADFFCYFEPP